MVKSPFNRGGLRFWLVLVGLIAGQATHAAILWGVPLNLLGVAIHLWAKGCLRQNRVVSRIGPYRYVRHPFYVANAFIDAGVAVMSGSWALQAALPVWWLIVYVTTMRREERHMISLFGPAYEDYMKRVPMFIPYRRPLPATGEGFSWDNRNIAAGREIPRALRLLAYPLLFYVVGGIRASGLDFIALHNGFDLWALAMLLTMYGLSLLVERSLKHDKAVLPVAQRRPWLRAVAAIGIVAVAFVTVWEETEAHHVMLFAGAAVLGLSVVLSVVRSELALLAECLGLVAVCILCELLWLMIVPILLYGALILDNARARPAAQEAPGAAAPAA
jgi:hypothetical protein